MVARGEHFSLHADGGDVYFNLMTGYYDLAIFRFNMDTQVTSLILMQNNNDKDIIWSSVGTSFSDGGGNYHRYPYRYC